MLMATDIISISSLVCNLPTYEVVYNMYDHPFYLWEDVSSM